MTIVNLPAGDTSTLCSKLNESYITVETLLLFIFELSHPYRRMKTTTRSIEIHEKMQSEGICHDVIIDLKHGFSHTPLIFGLVHTYKIPIFYHRHEVMPFQYIDDTQFMLRALTMQDVHGYIGQVSFRLVLIYQVTISGDMFPKAKKYAA